MMSPSSGSPLRTDSDSEGGLQLSKHAICDFSPFFKKGVFDYSSHGTGWRHFGWGQVGASLALDIFVLFCHFLRSLSCIDHWSWRDGANRSVTRLRWRSFNPKTNVCSAFAGRSLGVDLSTTKLSEALWNSYLTYYSPYYFFSSSSPPFLPFLLGQYIWKWFFFMRTKRMRNSLILYVK